MYLERHRALTYEFRSSKTHEIVKFAIYAKVLYINRNLPVPPVVVCAPVNIL